MKALSVHVPSTLQTYMEISLHQDVAHPAAEIVDAGASRAGL